MVRVAGALVSVSFVRVLTTPLVRARESAALILGERGLEAEVVPGWSEIDFGQWEGWTWDEVRVRDPEGHRRWEASGAGDFTFPGGESRAGFDARIAAAARAWLGPEDPPTLVVAHKGVIKGVLGHLLGLGPDQRRRMEVHLGSIHRIGVGEGGFVALGLNEVHHLGSDHLPDAPPTPGAPR
jgi:probable phosphoglycerate mutase